MLYNKKIELKLHCICDLGCHNCGLMTKVQILFYKAY